VSNRQLAVHRSAYKPIQLVIILGRGLQRPCWKRSPCW